MSELDELKKKGMSINIKIDGHCECGVDGGVIIFISNFDIDFIICSVCGKRITDWDASIGTNNKDR